ncbi:MAG TPA: hypothetical protein VF483_05940 [Gemmatimonadaceae bacterium]
MNSLDDTVAGETAQSRIVTARELGVVAALLAALATLGLAMGDGRILLTRALWVDEVHTVLLAGRASPIAVISDLANGADFGPPLVPLAAWTLRHVVGPLTPVLLHSASLICVLVALILIYRVLRFQFDAGASLVGTVAVGTQELVIAHSFEGRFYGPWLLCMALFALAVASPRKRWRLAIASVLLCTVHWYGVIALCLMIAGAVAIQIRAWRVAARGLWPAVAGPIALAVCIPLSIGQRHALSVATWVADFSVTQLTTLLSSFWTTAVPAVASLIIAVAFAVRVLRPHKAHSGNRRSWNAGIAAFMALALTPFALAALSLVGQPSMVPRYNLPAVLAWAPLCAVAAALLGRWPQRAAALALAWLWLAGYSAESIRKRRFDTAVHQLASALHQASSLGMPVVFANMHSLYAVSALAGVDRSAIAFLEITDSTTSQRLSKGALIERDVVRVHAHRFQFPKLVRQDDLRTAPRFAVVGLEPNLLDGYSSDVFAYGRIAFPGFCPAEQGQEVTVFVRGVAKC